MDDKQAADAARVETNVAAPERVDSGLIAQRSLTGSAMQMVAHAAELGGTALVTGAGVEAGRRLTGQAFDRPADPPPPPKIEVEHGYRPKSGE
jgi:hypothetical protein